MGRSMEKTLRCVKKGSKYKVTVDGEQGFVQFPNHLRGEGKVYKAHVSYNGKFWILDSHIRDLNEAEIKEEQARKEKEILRKKISEL